MSDKTGKAKKHNLTQERHEYEKQQEKVREKEAKKNSGFIQMYPPAFQRLRRLMANPKTVNAASLYTALAEHVDNNGLVVAPQSVLADMVGVSTKTIQRQSKILEDDNALVRIQLQGGVYAYALNPEEVWKAYDTGKEYAAFYSKVLVSKKGDRDRYVKKRLTMFLKSTKTKED